MLKELLNIYYTSFCWFNWGAYWHSDSILYFIELFEKFSSLFISVSSVRVELRIFEFADSMNIDLCFQFCYPHLNFLNIEEYDSHNLDLNETLFHYNQICKYFKNFSYNSFVIVLWDRVSLKLLSLSWN